MNGSDVPASLRHFTVRLPVTAGWVHAATGVDLDLPAGQVTAVVGESGCGKSTLLAALTGTLPSGARTGGTVQITRRHPHTEAEWAALRGSGITAMPAPASTGLSPTSTVGRQLGQVLSMATRSARTRKSAGTADIPHSVESLLRLVELDPVVAELYPHQLSGGMAARALLAATVAAEPAVLLCDEPTAALDHDTAAGILRLLRHLADTGMAVALVTHDLDQLDETRVADSVAVMYAGRIVEHCSSDTLFAAGPSLHPYARALLESLPRRGFRPIPGLPPELTNLDPAHTFDTRIEAQPIYAQGIHGTGIRGTGISGTGISGTDGAPRPAAPRRPTLAADGLTIGHGNQDPLLRDFSLTLRGGTITGLAGRSGVGKTTLARSLAGLHLPHSGTVRVAGATFDASARPGGVFGHDVALLFQSPRQAVDPSMTVRELIAEPITGRRRLRRRDTATATRVEELAVRVGLTGDLFGRQPAQLSDGQLQRVCLARAMAQNPRVLLCDEATAMLDAASTAAIAALITDLVRHGLDAGDAEPLAVLAISHDRALLDAWADETITIGDEAARTSRVRTSRTRTSPTTAPDLAPDVERPVTAQR